MGKRKSAAPVRPRVKPKLETTFNCPLCNHSRCVETKLERRRGLGTLICRICNANYAVKISGLTEPIDIYSDWIDRCEARNDAPSDVGWSVAEEEQEEKRTERHDEDEERAAELQSPVEYDGNGVLDGDDS